MISTLKKNQKPIQFQKKKKQKEQLDLLKNTQDRRRKQPLQNEILEHNVHYSPKL